MSPAPGAERLRAVLDTNLYVSAFQFPKGRNAALWNAALEGRFQVIVSPAIIREMARVLRRDFRWAEERIQTAVRVVARVAGEGVIVPSVHIRAIAADADDNAILECAVDGKADLIVSNDRHLLNLKQHAGLPIVGSVDFRRTLGLK